MILRNALVIAGSGPRLAPVVPAVHRLQSSQSRSSTEIQAHVHGQFATFIIIAVKPASDVTLHSLERYVRKIRLLADRFTRFLAVA